MNALIIVCRVYVFIVRRLGLSPLNINRDALLLCNGMDWFADSLLTMILIGMGAFGVLFISVAFYAVFKALRQAPMGPKEMGEVMKEIVRDIIKVRCPYCGNLYNETLEKCPTCGANHPKVQ